MSQGCGDGTNGHKPSSPGFMQTYLKYPEDDERFDMERKDALFFENRQIWRVWLEKNHDRMDEVWLLHFNKRSGMAGLCHVDAVEEAICYGWIDSKLRNIDADRFALRYTPRRKNCVWSEINKKTAKRMITSGRMTRPGLDKIEEAKKNGRWASAYSSRRQPMIPEDLRAALAGHRDSWENFRRLSNTRQTQYIAWVESAVRPKTREQRINIVVKRSCYGLKPGEE